MKTKLIYHYCSFETFNKILKYKTLRFSDVMMSNDKYEIIYLLDDYVNYVKKNFENPYATKSLKWFISEQNKSEMHLSLALSRNGDMLHLWNLYGFGGVSIGFDESGFNDWLKKTEFLVTTNDENEKNGMQAIYLKDVVYLTREENEQMIDQYFNKLGKDNILNIFNEIYEKTLCIKTDYFECEKETRAIIRLPLDKWQEGLGTSISGVSYDIDKINYGKAEFQKNNEGEILFVDIPFPTHLIKEIIIDKNCPIEPRSVKNMLEINGFSTEMITIKKSIGAHRIRKTK